MIVTKEVKPEYEKNEISIEGKKTKISVEDESYIIEALTEGLYADKYSFIKELVSNAYDATVEVDPDLPINLYIGLHEESNQNCLIVEDFGNSLSDEEMYLIYNNLGKSSSRGDANKIGGYGLGSKSPLAYVKDGEREFYIETNSVKDNKTRYWVYSREVDSVPELFLVNEKEREEDIGTGTKVIVPIMEYDEDNVMTNTLKKTVYFPNVVYHFEIQGASMEELNQYELFDYGTFYVRTYHHKLKNIYENILSSPHIVANNIIYYVDRPRCLCPNIGVKVDLNKLDLTRSRESIKNSDNNLVVINEAYLDAEISFRKKILDNYKDYTFSSPKELFDTLVIHRELLSKNYNLFLSKFTTSGSITDSYGNIYIFNTKKTSHLYFDGENVIDILSEEIFTSAFSYYRDGSKRHIVNSIMGFINSEDKVYFEKRELYSRVKETRYKYFSLQNHKYRFYHSFKDKKVAAYKFIKALREFCIETASSASIFPLKQTKLSVRGKTEIYSTYDGNKEFSKKQYEETYYTTSIIHGFKKFFHHIDGSKIIISSYRTRKNKCFISKIQEENKILVACASYFYYHIPSYLINKDKPYNIRELFDVCSSLEQHNSPRMHLIPEKFKNLVKDILDMLPEFDKEDSKMFQRIENPILAEKVYKHFFPKGKLFSKQFNNKVNKLEKWMITNLFKEVKI